MSRAPIRCLIVDDERLARAELRRLLGAFADVSIVGEACNAEQAVSQVQDLTPDLLLLDVQMPGGSGFDVLAVLERAPQVIFTTAYEQHALRAFEVNALDYLLKPIEVARLTAALQRVRGDRLAAPRAPDKLFIRDGERCWFVAPADIRLLESEGNYTRVVFSQGRALVLRSLNQFEQQFEQQRDGHTFFRASRRHIVNLDAVRSCAFVDGGSALLELADGARIEVSRRRAALLRGMSRFAQPR